MFSVVSMDQKPQVLMRVLMDWIVHLKQPIITSKFVSTILLLHSELKDRDSSSVSNNSRRLDIDLAAFSKYLPKEHYMVVACIIRCFAKVTPINDVLLEHLCRELVINLACARANKMDDEALRVLTNLVFDACKAPELFDMGTRDIHHDDCTLHFVKQ